jgi:type II secretion system (T2SS) protein E
MPPTRVSLEELLLRHGAITEEQLQRARAEQKTVGGDLGRTLVHLGFISEALLVRAWAHQMGVRPVTPHKAVLAQELLQALSVQVCETFGIIAVGRDARTNTLIVATSDPVNPVHLESIEKAIGERVLAAPATASSIESAIRQHYYGEPPKAEPDAESEADGPFDRSEAAGEPQLAMLLARIEKLEQDTSARDKKIIQVLRTVGDVLVEKGLISREEYLRRALEE